MSVKLAWCNKCLMETCWLFVATSKNSAEWQCDRCVRQNKEVLA